MYKNILQNIENVSIWPIISLSIFFVFFLLLLWWVFTADKDFIRKMKNLPLENSGEQTDQTSTQKS